MPVPMEQHNACLIDWAVEHAEELWITADLEPRPGSDGAFHGDFTIRSSGLTGASGGQGEGGLYVHYRFNNSRSYPYPCGNPSLLAAEG